MFATSAFGDQPVRPMRSYWLLFVIEGLVLLVLGGRWGRMLFSGIVDLVPAAIAIAGFPGTALWALGILSASTLSSAAPR